MVARISPFGSRASYSFDVANRQVAVRDPNSLRTSTVHDKADRAVATIDAPLGAALSTLINDIHSMGLETAQGLIVTEAFYWNRNDESREGPAGHVGISRLRGQSEIDLRTDLGEPRRCDVQRMTTPMMDA